MRNYILAFLILVITSCGGLHEQYVASDRSTYEILAPRIEDWLRQEPGWVVDPEDPDWEEQIDDLKMKLRSWDYRITEAEKFLSDVAPVDLKMADFKEVTELAEDLGKDILDKLKDSLKEKWDGIPDQNKDDVKAVAKRVASLHYRQLSGEDVASQLQVVRSIVLDYEVVAALKAVSLAKEFWQAVLSALKQLGSVLIKVAIEEIKDGGLEF